MRRGGKDSALDSTAEILWPSSGAEPDVNDLRCFFFCSPLSLHDFGNLWSLWTWTKWREWTLLSICHRWSVSHMFCILISGQDKHKVSQFSWAILCPSNLISLRGCLRPDLCLFSFLCHCLSYLISIINTNLSYLYITVLVSACLS